ncbi:hypothetical protein CGMCC3_g11555 [Colletotrichum fructicola]|uniref:Uncharacterized protein n=1 Tax=Colletotrichum fructicola (strain Nara gc5) TaxID=1213859 RepID=A0A7J6J5N3_COLFN|nr:uncharacterized protein CGMCC3_g11555 [Colletotrichum fructicola]KAE9572524.1 hypothetical protein CGMCC3_g11555 [Colletotrichum fructicola]KAF4484597.1 hypothetical protein CGGC5_v008016 [Colletotrichum fructicola Nara gc5]KAF5499842.1 hypothetical protein CGCF413_v007282 [Colletotrichum fructicola]
MLSLSFSLRVTSPRDVCLSLTTHPPDCVTTNARSSAKPNAMVCTRVLVSHHDTFPNRTIVAPGKFCRYHRNTLKLTYVSTPTSPDSLAINGTPLISPPTTSLCDPYPSRCLSCALAILVASPAWRVLVVLTSSPLTADDSSIVTPTHDGAPLTE